MINKLRDDPSTEIALIPDGASIFIGGMGGSGVPETLGESLVRRMPRHLTLISNNGGLSESFLPLFKEGMVDILICSFPLGGRNLEHKARMQEILSKNIDVEVIPQGTFVERIRAAGAGLGGVLTPAGVGTPFCEGKKELVMDGATYIVEPRLRADYALIKASRADRWGNLSYRAATRNFSTIMAMAASKTIAEAETIEQGALDPEMIHTPGIFVDSVVQCKMVKIVA